MVYKALLWTDIFRISYIKWYKFWNSSLLVILGSRQGGKLKLVNWASVQLLTLLTLFTLPKCQVIFQWKQKKGKLGNALSLWKNFCVDLHN